VILAFLYAGGGTLLGLLLAAGCATEKILVRE
jgi:hypothetical protein